MPRILHIALLLLAAVVLAAGARPVSAQEGCGSPLDDLANYKLRDNARDRMLRAEAELVAVSAEQGLAEIVAVYPLLSGVQHRLPCRELLFNPYSLKRTEPSGAIGAWCGQIGYDVVVNVAGDNCGYWVSGWGRQTMALSYKAGYCLWWLPLPPEMSPTEP